MKQSFYLLVLLLAAFSCKKEDNPCEGVSCLNDGSCIDGTCFCVGLWTGKRCDEQLTPVLISIRKLAVTKMPLTDASGAGWDLTSGADIYFVIKQYGQVLLSAENSWVQNAPPGTTWDIVLSINDPTAPITIELWDFDDFDSDDFMGLVQGTIYNNTNGFPPVVATICSSCDVEFAFSNISYY